MNKKYKFLLFDLDNTVLDFTANEKASLPKTFEHFGVHMTDEHLQTYERVNRGLWRAYEDQKIDMDYLLAHRFADTMKEFGKTIDGKAWNDRYLYHLSTGNYLMEGADIVIPALAKEYRLFIASNGVTSTQENRLRMAGLFDCFEQIFTSQAIGYQKPDSKFFEFIKNAIPDFDISQAIMIGDNLKNDIRGAKAFGLQTCMLTTAEGSWEGCDYVIHKLSDLQEQPLAL